MAINSREKLYNPQRLNNFKELINRSANLYKNDIAFKYKKSPKDTNIISVTYSEFKNDIDNLGTALLDLGFANKRIIIISPNRYEWCVSYLAITTGNMVVVPLDKSLPENELIDSVIRSEADAVIFDKKYMDTFKKIYESNKSNLKNYICIDSEEDTEHVLSYKKLILHGKELIENGDRSHLDAKIDNKKMSIMLFTSGTTSLSKIVMLSHYNICSNVYALGCVAKVTHKDTFLSFLPLHHTYESTTTFLYGLSCGITIAFCDGLRYIVNNLKEYKVTGFVCVPVLLETMYKRILQGIEKQGKTKLFNRMTAFSNFLLKFKIDIRRILFKSVLNQLGGHLRVVVYGAASIDKNTVIGLKNIGINMLNGYGLTETSPVLSAENDKYKKAGSVAFPMPGMEIMIDSPDEKGVGEICAKGPCLMLGYYKNEEATKEAIKDGWFHTGDLGYYDKDGYLFISGRKKNVIILKNGKNIFPEELETLIAKLPYVTENMVYARDRNEDIIVAVKIVYNESIMKEMFPNATKDDYHDIIWKDIKEINKTLPKYKYIKHLIVTDIPMIKTTTQKIKRHEELKNIKD